MPASDEQHQAEPAISLAEVIGGSLAEGETLAISDWLGEGWYRRYIEHDLRPLVGGTSR